MRTLHPAPDPLQTKGHYLPGRTVWFEESVGRWFPVTEGTDHLEIGLEDVGGTSWWHSLLCTLASQNGSAYARFVAVAHSGDQPGPAYRLVSAPFPRLRSVPDDVPPQEAWTPGMTAVLDDLRARLERAGWIEDGHGELPWSFRYRRPRVAWDRPYDAPEPALREALRG